MKYYNELEQSWRKLKQDHPEVAKAIEESDNIEYLFSAGDWVGIHDPAWADNSIYRAPMQTEAEKFLEKWGGRRFGKKVWGDTPITWSRMLWITTEPTLKIRMGNMVTSSLEYQTIGSYGSRQ